MVVTAIVPAYNEERYIARTLAGLVECAENGIIDAIRVIDDGSVDRTVEIAKAFPVEVYSHKGGGIARNCGKLQAFLTGVCDVPEGAVLTMDADMANLSPSHVRQLLAPLSLEYIDMAASEYDQEGDRCLTYCSGVRAIKTRALEFCSEENERFRLLYPFLVAGPKRGFALEPLLNYLIPSHRVEPVQFSGLASRQRGGGMTPLDDIRLQMALTDSMVRKLAPFVQSPQVMQTAAALIASDWSVESIQIYLNDCMWESPEGWQVAQCRESFVPNHPEIVRVQ